MLDLLDKRHTPTLEELAGYIRCPLFSQFCQALAERCSPQAVIEYSRCSLMPGWNLKLKKGGKSSCTIYPQENAFTVLVVVGQKERLRVEAMLPMCSPALGEIYRRTPEGNGQRWLMIRLEDAGALSADVLRLIDIRRESR